MKTSVLPSLLAVLLCHAFFPLFSQPEDVIINKAIEVAVDEIPSLFLDDGDLNDPGGPVDTTFDWSAIWRSSDLQGERGTQRPGPDDWESRPKGKRKGCICMDGTEQRHKGRGACGGRGGVRYWIYLTPEDKEVLHATARHHLHPEPLTDEQKLALAAYNEEQKPPPASSGLSRLDLFVTLAIVLATLTMVVFFMRHVLGPQQPAPGNRQEGGGSDSDF